MAIPAWVNAEGKHVSNHIFSNTTPATTSSEVAWVGLVTVATTLAQPGCKERGAWLAMYVMASVAQGAWHQLPTCTTYNASMAALAVLIMAVTRASGSCAPWSVAVLLTQQSIKSHISAAAIFILTVEAAQQLARRSVQDLTPLL